MKHVGIIQVESGLLYYAMKFDVRVGRIKPGDRGNANGRGGIEERAMVAQ